jgi:Dolichyl-phosphate-mannose-protein mannosyltransferase
MQVSYKARYLPLAMAGFLLVVAASRMIRLPGLNPDVDEIWSIWQTFGTPQQIINWTPYDWPPLYYLALGAWKGIVGFDFVLLRLLSVLAFLPGVACMYRAGRRLFGGDGAWLAVLTFAGFGYVNFLSTIIRGYAFLIALTPLLLWLTLRYFTQPTRWRAVWLALCMAVMFYTHLTSVVVYGLIGLYTLIVYRGRVWRWLLPGILAAFLAAPLILSKLAIVVNRSAAVANIKLLPASDAFTGVFADFTGSAVTVWAFLFALATLLILLHWRTQRAQTFVFALWILVIPILYVFNPLIGFFNLRYMWWGVFGLALWIVAGLVQLPRPWQIAAGALIVVLMFAPVTVLDYALPTPPLIQNFNYLVAHIQGGDVFLIDPNCDCATPETWDTMVRLYFPGGLSIINDPQGYRRIWYADRDGDSDPATKVAVATGRVAANFVGPADFLFRLYEAPPDAEGVLFENGMRFHGVDVVGDDAPAAPVRHEGEPITLRLWWSVDKPPVSDYSIGLYLMTPDGSKLITQVDGSPQIVDLSNVTSGLKTLPTSQMMPGQFYVDQRDVSIPNPTNVGPYAIYMTVYDSATTTKISASGLNKDKLLLIQPINVKSW